MVNIINVKLKNYLSITESHQVHLTSDFNKRIRVTFLRTIHDLSVSYLFDILCFFHKQHRFLTKQ